MILLPFLFFTFDPVHATRVKSFVIFCYVLVCFMWLKLFKPRKVPAMIGRIMVYGALTYCTLLHFMCDLKATQMNVQCILIKELILYKSELTHNAAETFKNIVQKVKVQLISVE